MSLPQSSSDGASGRVYVYPLSARAAAAALVAISRGSLPVILLLVLVANDPPITPPILLRLFLIAVATPALLACLVEHAYRATWQVDVNSLVVIRRGLKLEIPFAAVDHIKVWLLPLPGLGLTLRTRSGRRFRFQTSAAADLIEALAQAGADCAAQVAAHPTLVYARALHASRPRRWYHLLGKFVLFALFPTALLFNVHQHIAHGGTLGEYYLLGLRSYLETFAVYWSTVTIYLMLYASVWRGLAEGAALLAAWINPSSARRVRIAAERACSILYYGGVPLILGLRFWPW